MRHPVFVLGLNFPGIDILKNFKKKHIPVYGFDFRRNAPGLYLRNAKIFLSPNPESEPAELINFLFSKAARFSLPPVLLITSDTYIQAVQKNKELLQGKFLFNVSRDNVIEDFLSKEGLYKRAVHSKLPAPKTFFPSSSQELIASIGDLSFPCIIKPSYAPAWREGPIKDIVKGNKVIRIASKEELLSWYERISIHNDNLIVQEIVEGPDENLFYFVSYMNKDGKCLGYFCGQKIRISPIHFGSASFMKTVDAGELRDISIEFLRHNKYEGPSGVEFKKDARDGVFKLVEINARFGLWDVVGRRLGVDVALIAYEDLIGKETNEERRPLNKEYRWVSFARDIPAFLEYKNEGLIGFWKWLKSLLPGKIVYADLYFTEPKLMKKLYLDRLWRKLTKRKRHV